eukprot:s1737_g3.t1
MGKGKKRLEGRSQRERQQVRKQMGTLRQLTIQPKTRARYDKAKTRFYSFLSQNSLELPRERSGMDSLLCDYLEYLWATGEGRALASDTLAALQDTSPKLRGAIPGAWRLLKTWQVNEIPCRAPPLPERVLKSLVGYFIFSQEPAMALSLLLGYYSMLRTGELLGVRNRDITVDEHGRTAVIALGLTKGGKRVGAAESVTVTVSDVIRRLTQWKRSTAPGSTLTPPPHTWRKSFAAALTALGLDEWEFRPYSLRRGGATFWFSQHGSLDRILLQGRWMAAKTARTYLNEGLAVLTEELLQKCGGQGPLDPPETHIPKVSMEVKMPTDCMTSPLDFQRVANFRDLAEGVGTLRRGKLFRTGHFAAALSEDLDRLDALGIRTYVDLRDGLDFEGADAPVYETWPAPLGF